MTIVSKSIPASPGQPVDHPVRLEALRDTGLLDSLPEESFDRYTRLAKILLGTEVSLVSLVDESRQFFKSQAGGDENGARETPLSHSFCKYVVADGVPFEVEDASTDERVNRNPAVAEYGVRSYLGMPLRTRDGMVLGSLCVFEMKPRKWSVEDQVRLSDLAGAVMREIELRERSTALKQSLAAAHQAEQDREKQLRMTVHDLRTPAASVSSCLDLLLLSEGDSALDEEQVELVEICKESTERLLTMVQGILEAGQAGKGHALANGEPVSASLILRRALRMVQPLADDAGLRLEVRMPDELLTLHADGSKLERVVLNVLTNALKYAPAGSLVVVELQRAGTAERPLCRISVADEGPGVAEEDRERIFLDREKGPTAAERGDASFGIGLGFCKMVMEEHGGEIGVTQRESGGSEFVILLPIAI